MIPPADSTNQSLATAKVIGGTLLLVVLGSALYWRGRRRATAPGAA